MPRGGGQDESVYTQGGKALFWNIAQRVIISAPPSLA